MNDSQQSTPPVLTKAQLIELLLQPHLPVNKREAQEIVDMFFNLIAQRLAVGTEVKLLGLGNFQVRSKAPRPGRNPRTGVPVPIEARRVVTFHASGKLKDQVMANEAACHG